jgi:hypothetical protein
MVRVGCLLIPQSFPDRNFLLSPLLVETRHTESMAEEQLCEVVDGGLLLLLLLVLLFQMISITIIIIIIIIIKREKCGEC